MFSVQTHIREPRLLYRPYLNDSNILIVQNWTGNDIRLSCHISNTSGFSWHYQSFSFSFVLLTFISMSIPDLEAQKRRKTFVKKTNLIFQKARQAVDSTDSKKRQRSFISLKLLYPSSPQCFLGNLKILKPGSITWTQTNVVMVNDICIHKRKTTVKCITRDRFIVFGR